MRPGWIILIFCLGFAAPSMEAAPGRIKKVLPHYLDAEGRHTLSPSLYERDAYQELLRQNPEKRHGLRFDVHWKAPSKSILLLRIEMRGARGTEPTDHVLSRPFVSRGGQWSSLAVEGENYKQFGELIAWRATLWDGEKLVDEYKSFLW